MKVIKPKALKKKGVIGLISPASSPDDLTRIETAVKYFESLGYTVKVGENVGKLRGYNAGTVEERVSDIHSMFEDKNVQAIIAVRGGYGTPQLLRKIDYNLIKKNPKILCGYSDLTALQMAIFAKTGLITFAGPMAAVDFYGEVNPYTEEIFWEMVTSKKKFGVMKLPSNHNYKVYRKGIAEGRVIGGNFALFMTLFGTSFLPRIKNNILLLEDVGEVPYRVDRMFAQLNNAKIIHKISALMLGQFTDCEEKEDKKTLTLNEVFDDYLSQLHIPIIANLPHGHITENHTIPLGVIVRVDANKQKITFLESAVE